MSKFVVAVFDTEEGAYKGSQALKDLHRDGDVSLYAEAIIEKNNDGKVAVKSAADEGPLGAALGLLTGSMVGAFAGPVGLLAGASVGTLSGLWYDMWNAGVDGDFVSRVGEKLEVGKCALVAEVNEDWQTPLDSRMKDLGGQVYRRWRIDVEDEQIERDIAATKREVAELKDEWKEATDETKASVKAKLDAAQDSLSSLGDKATRKLSDMKAETEAKIGAIEDQIKTASAERKGKLEARRDALNEDLAKRSEKLKQAGQLIGEAVTGS
ncbi:DUF1269 domain-containing protein [Fuerstiella marisgermanici]|uniref:Putative membrane protein n=1 Tax=Fuerstiella marisgermanici TaxID=1891926 RepID=A0A1P8WC32_9PLAN|nr:DUF1269 domain-containing protein [Fuerstiella marisgermanici]APZ91583.1 putative membrane protein [Fuerstiella marisgermanici]